MSVSATKGELLSEGSIGDNVIIKNSWITNGLCGMSVVNVRYSLRVIRIGHTKDCPSMLTNGQMMSQQTTWG